MTKPKKEYSVKMDINGFFSQKISYDKNKCCNADGGVGVNADFDIKILRAIYPYGHKAAFDKNFQYTLFFI